MSGVDLVCFACMLSPISGVVVLKLIEKSFVCLKKEPARRLEANLISRRRQKMYVALRMVLP